NGALSPQYASAPAERLIPNQVSVFERPDFEAHTTELSIYDTVNVAYSSRPAPAAGAVSPLYTFVGPTIPVHDSITVRIQPTVDMPFVQRDKVVIKSVAGSRTEYARAAWQNGWVSARFRQFGTYQAFVDLTPPTINEVPSNLGAATRIVLTPRDNMGRIRSFRAELNGKWLMFTNDKHTNYIYRFDEHFPRGSHELKVTIEDIAGNVTTRTWKVRR
ncbi:MAG TPA: M23 family peptidase, partial [Chitinophagaceae bacterium]